MLCCDCHGSVCCWVDSLACLAESLVLLPKACKSIWDSVFWRWG